MTCRPTQSEFLKVETVKGPCNPCGNEMPDSKAGEDEVCNGHQSTLKKFIFIFFETFFSSLLFCQTVN